MGNFLNFCWRRPLIFRPFCFTHNFYIEIMDISSDSSPENLREAPPTSTPSDLDCQKILDIDQSTSSLLEVGGAEKSLSSSTLSEDHRRHLQQCKNINFDANSLEDIIQGSPGSTPFPRRQKSTLAPTSSYENAGGGLDGSYLDVAQELEISDANISFTMAPPPPNTPNQSNLEDEIIKEAQRQEMMLKMHMEKNILNFDEENKDDTPDPSGENRDIQAYDSTMPCGSREMQRRKRMQSAIQRLKNIVPGLNENSSEMEIMNMTAKYIEFMRHFVDVEHDKQFLMSQ